MKCLEYKGNKCIACGYDRYYGALEFHHLNPDEKEFSPADLMTYSWKKLEEELKKFDQKIAEAKEREGEIEVRDAILDKADFLKTEARDYPEAEKFYREALTMSGGASRKMEILFEIIQMNLEKYDMDALKKDVATCKQLVEEGAIGKFGIEHAHSDHGVGNRIGEGAAELARVLLAPRLGLLVGSGGRAQPEHDVANVVRVTRLEQVFESEHVDEEALCGDDVRALDEERVDMVVVSLGGSQGAHHDRFSTAGHCFPLLKSLLTLCEAPKGAEARLLTGDQRLITQEPQQRSLMAIEPVPVVCEQAQDLVIAATFPIRQDGPLERGHCLVHRFARLCRCLALVLNALDKVPHGPLREIGLGASVASRAF